MYSPVPRIRSGFTLIEILIVVTILGILAMIVLPTLTGARGQAKQDVFVTNMRDLAQIAQLYHQKHRALPPQGAGAVVPAELLSEAGRAGFPLTTPLGGYWHMGQMPDGSWGVGVWWNTDTDDARMKRDCKAVDETIDDGELASGRFVCDEGTSRYYWLIE